jgi:hypothetical protein
MPVGAEPGAGGGISQARLNVRPGRRAMLVHVVLGDAVGYSLKAEGRQQPVKNRRRVAEGDGSDQASPANRRVGIV